MKCPEERGRTRLSKKTKGDEYRFAYVCNSRDKRYKKGDHSPDWKRNKYCQNTVSIESQRLEDVIWDTLSEILKVSNQEKEKFKELSLSVKSSSKQGKDKEMDSLHKELAKIEGNIRRLEDGISDKEIEKMSNPTQAKTIDRFIDKAKQSLEMESLKKIGLENSITSLLNDSLWVDWVKDYQDKMKNLDELSQEERNDETLKYLQRIDVSFNPDKRTHNLKLRLKLPLIGDTLVHKDKKKKSKGYKITEGSYEQEMELPTTANNLGKTRWKRRGQ